MQEKAVLAFEATYSDFKLIRTRKCVQLIFEIPLEKATVALTVLGGMPSIGEDVWCAIARLDMNKEVMRTADNTKPTFDNAPASDTTIPARAHKTKPEDRIKLKAALACSAPMFWKFVRERFGREIEDKEAAALFVRQYCRIDSRSELTIGSDAAALFEREIYGPFIAWQECVDA